MRIRKFIGLLSCIALVLCLYVTQSANATSAEEEALQVVTAWTKAFNDADFGLWSSMYWKSPKTSSFAPPQSMAFLTQGYEAILANLKPVFEYPKGTYVLSTHNIKVTMLEDNVAVITQYQIMTVNPPAVKEQIIEQQRGTFVIQKIGGKWLIVHDHGSYLPTK